MGKKLLAALLCMMMVTTLLAGCGAAPATPTTAAATTAAATTAAATTAAEATTAGETTAAETEATTAAPTVAEKKELTINWGVSMSDPNADDFGLWMQSNFKVKLVPVAIDDAAKLKMLAASDTLPDLIGGMAVGDATFNQLRSEGMIRDFSDAILTNYPLLKKTIDEHPILSSLKASLGTNYWLPIYADADTPLTAGSSPIYYRADWAEKLGIAPPTTMEEYYNMLKAFTEKDPDGNGANDTYGLTGWIWQVHFISWVDMYAWVKGDDGKWVPGFTSPKMLDALKFYNKLYKEKILDPEFANANAKNMFFTDKVGAMVGNGTPYWVWKNIFQSFAGVQHSGKDYSVEEAMKAVQFLPPLKADASSQPKWVQKMNVYGYAIGAKASDEVVDRILEIANWELSPDGRDFITYGFKDKDWLVKDGKAVSILPNNPSSGAQKKLWEVYPSMGGFQICEEFVVAGTPWLNPPMPQECYDKSNEWETIAAPFVLKSNLLIDNLSTPAKDKCAITSDACEADFQNLIASPNIEADWEKLMKSYLGAQGLQASIDEVNAVVASKGLDK
jgi:putative aldouronate transport system substrate-binding protein